MAWESKHNKLGSGSADLDLGDVTALPTRKFIEFIYHIADDGTDDKRIEITLNNDGGSDYARRHSVDGAADSTVTSQSKIEAQYDGDSDKLHINIMCNISAEEKLIINEVCESTATGAGTAPHRVERVWKYTDTATGSVTRIDSNKGAGVNYDINDYVVAIYDIV